MFRITSTDNKTKTVNFYYGVSLSSETFTKIGQYKDISDEDYLKSVKDIRGNMLDENVIEGISIERISSEVGYESNITADTFSCILKAGEYKSFTLKSVAGITAVKLDRGSISAIGSDTIHDFVVTPDTFVYTNVSDVDEFIWWDITGTGNAVVVS